MRPHLALLVALLAGCAAAPSAGPSRSSPTARSSDAPMTQTVTTESEDGYAPPPESPVRESPRDRPTASPPVMQPGAAPTVVGRPASGAVAAELDFFVDGPAAREARIGAQVRRIRDEQIRLATSPGVCRDICFASGSICLAAQELCRLTGDADDRCGRARGACADAGRQRDGACPVCPAAR